MCVCVYQIATSFLVLYVSCPLPFSSAGASRHIFPLCPPMKLNQPIEFSLACQPLIFLAFSVVCFIERPFLCVCVCIYTLLEFLDRSSICRRSFRCASLPLLVKYKKKRRRKNAVRADSCRVAEPPANLRIHFKVNKQNILHFSLFFTIPGLRRKQPVSYYFYVFFLSLNNWIPPSIITYIFEN